MAKKRRSRKAATAIAKPRPNFPPKLNLLNRVIRDVNPDSLPEPHHMRDEERSYRFYEDKK